jgi:hypothetical protein
MHTIQRTAIVFASAVLILACGLPSITMPGAAGPTLTPAPAYTDTAPAAATATTAPTQPPAATNTAASSPSPEPPGIQVSYDKLHIWLPAGLATSTTNSTVTDFELPYMNGGQGPMPPHLKLTLNDYPVQGSLFQPQVMVFPADQYTQYAPLTGQIVTTLRDVPYMDGQPLPPGLPTGPVSSHVGSVMFANGHGIRYLTQFDQAPLPVNNQELIYYFHGLTDDGTAYIEAVLPVQAPFLPADYNANTPLPSDGVPFTMDNLGAYFQDITDKLNATPPNGFNPSLDTLDALLRSISVK